MNSNLTFNQSLELLNEIASFEYDSDWDSESILYIAVRLKEAQELIRYLIGKEEEYKKYIEDFAEDETIDICQLWGDVSETFNVDIWYNMKKKEFYEVKLHHKVYSFYSSKKRMVKRFIKYQKEKYRLHKYSKMETKKLKKRLKLLSKMYGGFKINE